MAKALQGKLALVTGASRGIGYATARALAEEGAHIIAVARTVGGLEELDDEIKQAGGSATLVPLDLKDGDGIDRLGQSIFERWGKLDILIANAGVLGDISPLAHLSPKEFETVFSVNVMANWRLIRSMDPLVTKSKSGRVLIISSGAARSLRPFWGAYSASKAALEALAMTYAREMAHTKVKTIIINPGPLRTTMRAKAMPGEDPTSLKTPDDLAPHLVYLSGDTISENGVVWDFPKKRFITL